MTFSLRRKCRIIHRVWQARRAMTVTISLIVLGMLSVRGQTFQALSDPTVLTPKFAPVGPRQTATPAAYVQQFMPQQDQNAGRTGLADGDIASLGNPHRIARAATAVHAAIGSGFLRTHLQDARRQPVHLDVIFPSDEPVISRESYVQPSYPRGSAHQAAVRQPGGDRGTVRAVKCTVGSSSSSPTSTQASTTWAR